MSAKTDGDILAYFAASAPGVSEAVTMIVAHIVGEYRESPSRAADLCDELRTLACDWRARDMEPPTC